MSCKMSSCLCISVYRVKEAQKCLSIFRRTYNRLTCITLTMTATHFTMDAVTVTCYDTKNRDQRPNEDLFYQCYPIYLPLN